MPETIGIIAGQGLLPIMTAHGLRAAGLRIAVAGFRGQADAQLLDLADSFRWVSVARPSEWVRVLRRAGVSQAIMVGRVRKSRLHSRWRWIEYCPDLMAVRIYFGLAKRDRRNEPLLRGVADALAQRGITLISSVHYCQDHLADAGHLAGPAPSELHRSDSAFAEAVCRVLVENDIGQAVVVKEHDVIAVEAIEGTDRLIQRAGELVRNGGWTLIKLAKRQQDERFDVPVIGPQTVENVAAAGGKCIAVEARRVLLLDKPQTLAAANKHRITLLGVGAGTNEPAA